MKNQTFPVLLANDTVDELATLSQMGVLNGSDIPDDLLETLINSDNK